MPKSPGPPPAAVKRRRNKDGHAPAVQGQRRGRTALLEPSPDWRTDVRNYFRSALASGQVDWYENSDVMVLYLQCEMLDKILRQSRTVPIFKQERNSDGDYIDVIDDEGNKIPELDVFGEPDRRVIGSINGQALKAVLDMGQDLLVTEGARRRLRIDLAQPESDDEPREKAIVARQRATVGKVAQPA